MTGQREGRKNEGRKDKEVQEIKPTKQPTNQLANQPTNQPSKQTNQPNNKANTCKGGRLVI